MTNEPENLSELISADGESRFPLPTNLPPVDDYVGPARPEEVEFRCGHKEPMFYGFTVYGDAFLVSEKQATERVMCANCLAAKMLKDATRCALCGRLIEPGTLVALYRDAPVFRHDALRVKQDGEACVLGCKRCAPDGVIPAGSWDGANFVSIKKEMRDIMHDLLGLLGEGQTPCAGCDKKDCDIRREPYAGSSSDAQAPECGNPK